MVELVELSTLIYGIILVAIGAILYYVGRYFEGGLRKVLEIGGIILAIIGIVLIVLSFLVPLLSSGLLILGG